jgi:hypothetical protein
MKDIYLIAETENGLSKEEIKNALLKSLEGRELKKVLILPPDFTRFHSGAGYITNVYYHALTERGAEVDTVAEIGVVSDYYNLIRGHNINRYYLARVRSFGERHLTADEIDRFHLSVLKLRFEDALREYERNKAYPLGRLITQRELPVLYRAKALLDKKNEF